MAAAHASVPRRRRAGLLAATLLAALLAGCGSQVEEGSRLTVYLGGIGLTMPERYQGVADGAELALEQAGGEAGGVPVELEVLPDPGEGEGWTQAAIAAGAREASEDSTAIAYLGEPVSEATAISVPITNEAGILQVATGPVDEEVLREPGGNDVPDAFQTTGERTLIALTTSAAAAPAEPDPGFAAEFEAAYDRPAGLAAAYGHAAMSLVLDSIAAADDPLDRLAVIDAALSGGERDSALGNYSIDAAGAGSLGG